MTNIFRIVLLLVIALPISACGLKGKLKTPDQIQKAEAKKEQEDAKKAQDKYNLKGNEPEMDKSLTNGNPTETPGSPTSPMPSGKK